VGSFFHAAWAVTRAANGAMMESARRNGGDENRARSKRTAFDLVIKRLQKTLAENVIRDQCLRRG
jgi:hypothetical protein